MIVIIKSGKKNWSGKEFSNLPAKIYSSFQDAYNAIDSYHFYKYNEKKQEFEECDKMQKLEFIFLSEKKQEALLFKGVIRR